MANYPVTQIVGISVMTSSTVAGAILSRTDPQKISQFPINILVYHRSLVAPNLAILALSIFFLQKRNYVKAFIQEFMYLHGKRIHFCKK